MKLNQAIPAIHQLRKSAARHSLAFIIDLSCKLKPVGGQALKVRDSLEILSKFINLTK